MSVGARNARIDMLRGASILLVLLHHFNIAYPLQDTTLAALFGWPAVRALARNGNYGVTVFFTISGFLITTNALRRWGRLASIELPRFYALRAARIVPCLLLLLCLVEVLASMGLAMFQNRGFGEAPVSAWLTALAGLTFWMNVLIARHGWVNYPLGVLWSLSVEEVFYLAFPLTCRLLRSERRMFVFWGLVILAGPLYRLAHQGDEAGFLYAYPACFDAIAIGCLAAVLAARDALSWTADRRAQGLVVLAMALLYLCWPIASSNVTGVTVMATGTALLLLGVHRHPAATGATGSTVGRGLAACGRLSYEIYLFHLIVLGLMRTALLPSRAAGDEKLGLMAAYLLLSVLVGGGIARGFAAPLNRRIRRWAAPDRAAGQPA